jgi:hypothetical protein
MKKARRKTGDRIAPRESSQAALAHEASRRAWRPHLLAVAALWTLALLAYSSSFGAGLVLDNRILILNDSRIQAATPRNAALILGQQYWYGNSASDLYRPLTTFSYLVNYAVLGNGPDSAGYHWVNLALHALNIALVYVLALWILGELRMAVAMTAVWAVHPVLTESVTNVVGRADLLAAFGVLAALICHIQAGRAAGWRKTRWLLTLALAAAVGIFSKESAIAVLGAMALYDLAFEPRSAWRARMVNYAAAALPCLLFLYVRGRVLAKTATAVNPFLDNPLTGADFWTARLTAVRVIGKYVELLFWPGRLSADYSYNQIPLFRMGDLAALAAVAVCAAVAAAAVWAFRRNPPVFYFVGLFFVTLAPVSNVFLLIGTIMAERFLYLPALGFAGCVAIGLRAASRRLPARGAPMLLAAVCAAFAIRTYLRNLDWATELTLMTSAAESAPDACRPHNVLMGLLTGDAAVAEADRTRAILDPLPDERNSPRPYTSMGICYRNEGDRVAARDPGEAQLWYRKSLDALLRARSIERAYDRMNQRENLRRGRGTTSFVWDAAYLELGRTYLRLSQPREALDVLQYGRPLTQRPEFFFEEISNAYRALGDSRQSAIALIEAVSMSASETQLAPAAVKAYGTDLSVKLVDLYRETEPRSCAVRETRGLRTIDMDCPLVKEQVCAALRALSREYPTKGMPAGCPAE